MEYLSMIIVGLILGSMLGWNLHYVRMRYKMPNNVRFYVARDKDGSIWLYMGKPKRDKCSFCSTESSIAIISSTYFSKCGLDANNYANIKWGDEPVEVFLNMED